MPPWVSTPALVWSLFSLAHAVRMRETEDADEIEDAASLGLLAHLSKSLPPEFNTSRLRILADIQSGHGGDMEEPYDCASYPHMCRNPFHCEAWTAQDTVDVRLHGLATPDHHANLRSWCMPGLERYAGTVLRECIANGNMQKSASVSLDRTFRDWADELDASYCFAEGHCTNQVVTDQTSLDDMEKMCDWRFGRKTWTRNFLKSLKRLFDMPGVFANLASTKGGFTTQRVTRVLSKMACAQGIFHCDVMYCKHTYCQDEYYVKKYEKLLPPMPGNFIRDADLDKEHQRERDE